MSDASEESPERTGRSGAVHYRGRGAQRVNAWRKHTPLNPYWLDWSLLKRSVEELAPEARGLLLDIGCSETPYRDLFEPHIERYVGLEYPPAILDKQPDLWDILDRARWTVTLFGDGCRLPFVEGCFDTVVATEVLEHLPEPEQVVREAARVLRPGGRLLMTVPFSQPLHELPGDYYRYTPSALEYLLEGAGLEVERIQPRGNFAATQGAMLSQFLVRWLAARERQEDGTVVLSRWRGALLIPVLAVIQVLFHWASKLTNDTTVVLGYSVVACKPGGERVV